MPPAPSDAPVGRVRGPVSDRLDRLKGSDPPDRSPGRFPGQGETEGRSQALATLLVDLGSQIQTATAQSVADRPRWHPTGLAPLDALLGGGFPIGRLSEICGDEAAALSAGRTTLALRLLAETLGTGVLAAWVDLADALDPNAALESIQDAGGEAGDLDRLLWVRARDEDEALRCCERLLRTEGFELVVFDLFHPRERAGRRPGRPRFQIKDVTWLRLARLAAGTRTTLVALAETPSTGSRAELVLEMQPRRVRFDASPTLLESLEADVVLRRHRSRPAGERIRLSMRTASSNSSTTSFAATASEARRASPARKARARPRPAKRAKEGR